MAFVWSLVAALAAVVVLGLLIAVLLGPVRRLDAARADTRALVPRMRTLVVRAGALPVPRRSPRVASGPVDREGISS